MPDILEQQGVHSRRIPPDEWERVREFGPFKDAGGVLPNPDYSLILGVYEGEQLIGIWMAKNTVMLEGLYLSPEYRHSYRAAKEITFGMIRELRASHVSEAVTLIQSPYIEGLAKKVGFDKLEGALHLLKIAPEGGS